jgi:hypothetical protein
MIPLIIGITSSIFLIGMFILLKKIDKTLVYGLILVGIGFLYVGFTWSDMESLIISSVQAIVFLFLAYYGIKKSIYILAFSYMLHGAWDLVYSFFDGPGLIPPQYDVFCLTFDFIIGIYLLVMGRKIKPFVEKA